MWTDYGAHMAWMGVWWIVGIACLVLFAWMLTRLGGPSSPQLRDDSPETILKRRYANGELSREEYNQRLTELRR